MSASPIARQVTQNQNIPSKRIVISDPNQLPVDYSSTPGEVGYENETQLARNRENNKADAIVGGLGISTIDKTRRREYESTRYEL
ncbi:Protein of unknown function [Cotesia congregata]|uniref:Uncharacterized protein n=1 Tax=Cotesia congregata TaxID=51543 RepID=A0A8J2HGL7_COTCN|nr:Protein of unknown function [Cotesia congregata]